MVYHVSNKKLIGNLPLKFIFTVSSRTLTAFWLLIFVSAKLSRTILSIDRSEPRFERHKKMMEISMVFVNFRLNQIQNCSVQIKKMKDRIFSFQLKKKLLLPNVYRQC